MSWQPPRWRRLWRLAWRSAWWNDDWNFRKVITVDTTPAAANLSEGLKDVPVLIRLHVGNFGYFGDTKPDGSDLRFVAADDKTPLPFHVESYDAGTGMAFIWVRLPAVRAASSDKIYMYYGNAAGHRRLRPEGDL